MTNKIILTESQYDSLRQYIVETKFDTFVKNRAKVGDIIRIEFNNTTLNFKVVRNDMGQIQMDNVDNGALKNYRYFISGDDLNNKKLHLSKVHKIKDKAKLNDVRSWAPENMNNVKNIELVRNGKVIDSVDNPDNVGDDFQDEAENNLAIILNQLAPDKGLKLIMKSGEELILCCMSSNNGIYVLDLVSPTENPNLRRWDSFVLTIKGNPDANQGEEENLYSQNKDIIKTSDNGNTFDLLFRVNVGEYKKHIWINEILGLSVVPSCNTSEEEPETQKDDDDILKRDGEKALELIIHDKNLQKAFYTQPNFWELFKAELKGKKAVGTGIITVIDLVGKYETKKINVNLDAEFIEHKKINFRPIHSVKIPYVRNDKEYTYLFDSLSNIEYTAIVAPRKLGENYKAKGKLQDYLGYELEILSKDKTLVDTYVCNLTMIVSKQNTIMRYPYDNQFPIKIDRRESTGYNPLNDENQN